MPVTYKASFLQIQRQKQTLIKACRQTRQRAALLSIKYNIKQEAVLSKTKKM